jgi:Gpi18-like mannosyltransferase
MRRLFTQISHYYVLAIAFMLGLIVFLPDSGYDKYFWVTWAQYIKEHGLTQAYNNPEINYHPVILCIIDVFTWFFNSPADINLTNINWLKVPTALFDWGIIFLSLKLMQHHKVNLQWGLLLAFNPAFWYNTIIWGQFDSIWVFFCLASIYVALKEKWFLSIVLYTLALNTKLFALMFLPFIFPLWIKDKTSQLQLLRPLPVLLILQFISLLPFLFTTHNSLFTIIGRSTDYYNSISRNAYNIWYFFFTDPFNTPDDTLIAWVFGGVIAVFFVLALLQLLERITIWQSAALASLIFFLFLTRMHERYAHAAIVFTAIVFFASPPSPLHQMERGGLRKQEGVRLLCFFLISLAYLLNLEAVMQMLNKSLGFSVDYNSILFNPKLIATLYVISLVILVISTFTLYKNSSERA